MASSIHNLRPTNEKTDTLSPITQSLEDDSNMPIESQISENTTIYLTGWRLYLAVVSLCMSSCIANLEIGIVSTSLVVITDELQGFKKSNWIVTAYLLTFTGFLIFWAKLAIIFGRKSCIIASVLIFTIFSGGCGAAQTINQLIICRTFQGIGGSGAYGLTLVIVFDLVPEVKWPTYISLVTMIMATALGLGPLIGGLINNGTTWRWVFLLNLPAGAVTILMLLYSIPNYFPHHKQPSYRPQSVLETFSKKSFVRLDLIGAGSLIISILSVLVALQLAGIEYAWSSALIIVFFIVSGLSGIFFFFWEWSLGRRNTKQEPLFPSQFFRNRVWLALLLNTFLVGAPFTAAVIIIPLRIQVVYGISALGAGLRLMPFVFVSPLASVLGSIAASRLQIPPVFLLIVGTALQVAGFALLSTLPTTGSFFNAQYGYQVIAALGTGTNIIATVAMVPYITDKKDRSIAIGTATQFRFLGGSLGLALVTSIGNSWVKSHLSQILTPEQLTNLLESVTTITTFEPQVQEVVRVVLARGYNLEMRIVIGICAAQILATLLMWQKKPVRILS